MLTIYHFLQEVSTQPGSAFGKLVFAVLTPLIGWLAKTAYDGVKTAMPFWDGLRPEIHAAAAPVFMALFGFLVSFFGLPGIGDILSPGDLTADFLNGLLVAATGAGIWRLEKRKSPSDASVVMKLVK